MGNALVTGTSTGIGLATAITLARAGHTVWAGMRNLDRGGALQETVAKERLPVTVVELDLGIAYANGYGLQKNLAAAVTWVHKAADQGDDKAQSYLGFMFENGYGVTPNYAEAAKWYRPAAEQGDAKGQYFLGVYRAQSKRQETSRIGTESACRRDRAFGIQRYTRAGAHRSY
jgi:TPR repeat protein